ncbi:MAG: CDP-diacylglycerol---serine O-phosphatidyltransferase [Rhodospirillaceae bacterium]|nr:CDP-diacylglycerol---serine O-phosphatidyltransferase [Rhodospirillaceae bacterium]
MQRLQMSRLRDHSFNRLIPNILTLLGLCAGLTSIRLGLMGRWELAVAAIALAAVLDGLDGRIARLLDSSSKFGAELDSLADVIGFGVAPALLLYLWTMHTADGLGWAVSLLFAVCCSLRLARFNTKLDNADLPAWTGRFFVGVPAPAAAGLALTPMMASFEFGSGIANHPAVVGIVMVGVAALMVSRIPTYSFKRLKVPPRSVLPTMLGIGLLIVFVISTPWITFLAVGLAYLASIPLSMLSYRRLAARRPIVEPMDSPGAMHR